MKKVSLYLLATVLTGCSLLEQSDPLPLYTLKSETFEQTNSLSVSLGIDVPLSEASLDTSRIALTPAPFRRDYLADGMWPDRLTKIFHETLLESLTERWGGTYVNRFTAGVQTKYLLQSDIQDFSVYNLEGNAPEIRLKIVFKLIDLRERHVLAAHTFSEITPASSPTMNGIVGAFNHGVHCLLGKAVLWMEDVFLKDSPQSH